MIFMSFNNFKTNTRLSSNSNLGPISHRLATGHLWQTDDRRTDRRMNGRTDDNYDNSSTVT